MPPLFTSPTSALAMLRCASAMSRPSPYSAPVRRSSVPNRTTGRSVITETDAWLKRSASTRAASRRTRPANGVSMRARTSRRAPPAPLTRTKSTTALPAPEAQTAGLDPGEGLGPAGGRRARRVGDVRREEVIVCLCHPGAQRIHGPVELVVADRRGVDPEGVHRGDHGPAEVEVGDRGPLHFVAGVEPDAGAEAYPRETVEPGLERRRSPYRSPVGPGPDLGLERPVEVVDRQHAQQRAVGPRYGRRGRGERLAQGRVSFGRPNRPAGRIRALHGQEPARPDLIGEQVPDRLAPVVHDARALEHGVAAATRLTVAVQRQREAVRRRDGTTAEREPADALPRGRGEVDRVRHAAHDVEVEARHAVVDRRGARLIGAEVAGRLLQIGLQLVPGDADGPQGVLVGVDSRHVALPYLPFRQARPQVEVRRGREIGAGTTALHLVDEVEQRRVLRAPVARGETRSRGTERRRRPRAYSLVRRSEAP